MLTNPLARETSARSIHPCRTSLRAKKIWSDAIERAVFAKQFFLDTMPGKVDQITEITYSGQRGRHLEFGEEILVIARRFGLELAQGLLQ